MAHPEVWGEIASASLHDYRNCRQPIPLAGASTSRIQLLKVRWCCPPGARPYGTCHPGEVPTKGLGKPVAPAQPLVGRPWGQPRSKSQVRRKREEVANVERS